MNIRFYFSTQRKLSELLSARLQVDCRLFSVFAVFQAHNIFIPIFDTFFRHGFQQSRFLSQVRWALGEKQMEHRSNGRKLNTLCTYLHTHSIVWVDNQQAAHCHRKSFTKESTISILLPQGREWAVAVNNSAKLLTYSFRHSTLDADLHLLSRERIYIRMELRSFSLYFAQILTSPSNA